jgi:hypothetical protein
MLDRRTLPPDSKMKFFGYPLAGVIFFLIAVAAGARVPTGTLDGVVVDARGKAEAGASVTVQSSDGKDPHAARTDARGRFQFARFERGQYDLRAFANGKSSDWLQRILVRSGKTTEVTLRLKD